MNAEPDHAAPPLCSEYFDGRQPLAHPVTLSIDGPDLVIQGTGFTRRVPLRQVRWPERQRHGTRLAYLPDNGLISHSDGPAWDDWARAQGLHEPLIVRWIQSWGVVCFALLVCLALGIVAWYWGIPGLDQAALAIIPRSLDESVGAQAMASFDRQGLLPSRLDAEQQAAIRRAFDASLERAYPAGARPYYTLNFRAAGRMNLGPNAFALPGGRIVLTDELVELLADAPDVTVGALAHELGHLQHRHGMRMLVQAGLLAALADWMLGDFSSVRSAVPAILGQQAYARDFERQADQEAIAVLRASGQTPSRTALLFKRLAAWRQQHGEDTLTRLPIALADHPADAERIRSFIEADGRR